MSNPKSYDQLLEENSTLQMQLDEVKEALRAIRCGEVDAMVVATEKGNQVFTLQSADQAYRLFLEQMRQGAVTISLDGMILYCNRYFTELLGHPSEAMLARSFKQHVAIEEHELFTVFLRTASSNEGLYQEFNLRDHLHQTIPVYISASLLVLEKAEVICLVITDLRERKKAERQAIELIAEKQRTQVLANFMRDTSHDLRTPITIIINNLYKARRSQAETERIQSIQEAENYVFYLNRLLEQFQQMAILDSLSEVPFEMAAINPTIKNAVERLDRQASEKNLEISTDLAPDLPLIRFDPDTMHIVVSELIRNAIQFSPQGGKIHVRSASLHDDQLMVEVIDNGLGIRSENLSRIFERFFKESISREMSGGAGLGLPIVKRIIELHRGSIEVESTLGYPTRFRVLLPIHAVAL